MIRHQDILEEWKHKRFIVADDSVRDQFEDRSSGHLIILTDFKFWADNIDDLVDWCEQYKVVGEGMSLTIPDDKLLTHFILRWSC